MTTTRASERAFVPGMGVDWLLPAYDPLTRLLGLERTRRDLVAQADLQPHHRVLDIGCGTGSLAVLVKQEHPDVTVIALDPDEQALERASRKARRAGVTIQFDRGFSDRLDYPAASFDRVVSSFMFHHLSRGEKEATLREVRRVLKAGGRLHLMDFAGGEPAHRPRVRGLHSHARLHDNAPDTVLALMTAAGLVDAGQVADRALLGGMARLACYRAVSPA